jgi:hypothetical protein
VQARVKSAGMMLGGIRWCRVELAGGAIPTLWGDRGHRRTQGGGVEGVQVHPQPVAEKKIAGRLVITVREKSNSAELLAAFGC